METFKCRICDRCGNLIVSDDEKPSETETDVKHKYLCDTCALEMTKFMSNKDYFKKTKIANVCAAFAIACNMASMIINFYSQENVDIARFVISAIMIFMIWFLGFSYGTTKSTANKMVERENFVLKLYQKSMGEFLRKADELIEISKNKE